MSREFAANIGCDTKQGIKKAVECLQSKTNTELIEASQVVFGCSVMGHLALNSPIEWVGSVDAEYDSDPFFLGDPVQLFLRGKFFSEDIPIMIGFNKDEGLSATTEFLQAPSTFERFKGEWDQCKTRHLFSLQNSEKANKLKS